MQRHITRQTPRQTRSGAADFTLARQKHQTAALGLAKCVQDQIADPILKASFLGQGRIKMAGLDRIGPPLRGQKRCIAKHRGDRGRIKGRRHHHDA